MNKEMFDKLATIEKEQMSIITAEDLLIYGCNNRTLFYGYTCERETFHVYIEVVRLLFEEFAGIMISTKSEPDVCWTTKTAFNTLLKKYNIEGGIEI